MSRLSCASLLFRCFLLFFVLSLLGGCGPPWKSLRSINPYAKEQKKEPYAYTVGATGGILLKVKKFYYTKRLACLLLLIDNSKGYSSLYIKPHKTQLVSGKTGIWAMKPTVMVRDKLFRQMAMAHYKIKDPKAVRTWYKFAHRSHTIKAGKSKEGFICFALARKENDPKRIRLQDRIRLRITRTQVGPSLVNLPWLWLGKFKK